MTDLRGIGYSELHRQIITARELPMDVAHPPSP